MISDAAGPWPTPAFSRDLSSLNHQPRWLPLVILGQLVAILQIDSLVIGRVRILEHMIPRTPDFYCNELSSKYARHRALDLCQQTVSPVVVQQTLHRDH